MIDLKNELQNFPPIDIQKLTDNHGDLPDNIRNSIMFYNKAIENMKMGSEDIAIIELKKAIQLNSEFHEAMNLLGICYLYINDSEKATDVFSKVMEVEKNGIKAMQLAGFVGSDVPKVNTSSDKAKQASVRRQDAISLGPVQKSHTAKKNSIRLLVTGVILGLLLSGVVFGLLYVIVLSNGLQDLSTSKDEITTLNSKISDLTKSNDQLNSQLKNLQGQNTNLKEEINTLKANPSNGSSTNLAKALEALMNNKYIEAADLFFSLEKMQPTTEEAAIIQKHKESTYVKASRLAYDIAINAYKKKDYQTGVTNFQKVLNYGGNYSYIVDAEYILGKCYAELKLTDKANGVFNDIITKYPNTDYAKWSKDRIVK